MHHARRKLTTVLLAGLLLGAATLAGAGTAGAATGTGPCSAKQAHRAVHAAHRAYVRAASRYREAKRVLSKTRAATSTFGSSVGRWVRLARRAGYAWWEMPILMRVVDRESEGDPSVPNTGGSGALGLLQIMPEWADGSKGWYWKQWRLHARWDRTSAWESLRHGSHMGWGNWGE